MGLGRILADMFLSALPSILIIGLGLVTASVSLLIPSSRSTPIWYIIRIVAALMGAALAGAGLTNFKPLL